MRRASTAAAVSWLVLCCCAVPARARAQAPRGALETTASGAYASDDNRPTAVFDVTGFVEVVPGLTAIARPWIWYEPNGQWTWQMYQLEARYVTPTSKPIRIDAGVIPSPIGLATQESRADLNPTIQTPFYYYAALRQTSSVHVPYVTAISAGYPLGVTAATSGTHWDVRAAVTDSSPAIPRAEFKRNQPGRAAQFVAGGGVTPITGFRIGAGVARGRYDSGAVLDTGSATPGPLDATVFNLEVEYAVRHTRLSGEWVHDWFATTGAPMRVRAFYLEGVQTVTPRLFLAGRYTGVQTAAGSYAGSPTLEPSGEAVAGFRLSPDLTVRGGYYAYKLGPEWDNQFEVSAVFARRWF